MLEKLQARRELLAKEHAALVEQHGNLNKTLKETEQKLSMLVGHVGELDYQIKELQAEEVLEGELVEE
jgi:hypothetical protein